MENYVKDAKIAAYLAYIAIFMLAIPYILWFHLLTPLLAKSYPRFMTSLDVVMVFFCLNILFWGYAIPYVYNKYVYKKNSWRKTIFALISENEKGV